MRFKGSSKEMIERSEQASRQPSLWRRRPLHKSLCLRTIWRCGLWREVLGVESVCGDDDFF